MIYYKGPCQFANAGGVAHQLQPDTAPGYGWGFGVQVSRPPYVDWRDTDRLFWLVAVADPWFGRTVVPFTGIGTGYYPEGGGWFKSYPWEGFAPWPGEIGVLKGERARPPELEEGHWQTHRYYCGNYPVAIGSLVQQARPEEPHTYTVGIVPEYWYYWPSPLGPATPIPVVICGLALSDCDSGGGAITPTTQWWQVSTALDPQGHSMHAPATRVGMTGLQIPTGGNKAAGFDGGVPSDLPGKWAHPFLYHEAWAVYQFAAREAVVWTKAPEGCEVLFRTPAGVAPSVMICAEEFRHRYWEPGRYAECDRESYLICGTYLFNSRLHYQVSYATRRDGTAAQVRTSGSNLVERFYYPPPYPGYTLPYQIPKNSLRAFSHRQGRVEIDDTLDTMRDTILGEAAVEGPAVDTPALLVQSDGRLRAIYARWESICQRVSADGGETWGAMEEIAQGYEACTAALHPETGMLVAMLWKEGPVAGSRMGEWYVTVGSPGASGATTWSTPRVVRLWKQDPKDIVPLYAKPWSGSLVRQSDGTWIFTFVGPEELWHPTGTSDWMPADIYQRAIRCQNLAPDGSGKWLENPRAA